jgi:hypothetical protein
MLPALWRALVARKLRSPRNDPEHYVVCTHDGGHVFERNLRRALDKAKTKAKLSVSEAERLLVALVEALVRVDSRDRSRATGHDTRSADGTHGRRVHASRLCPRRAGRGYGRGGRALPSSGGGHRGVAQRVLVYAVVHDSLSRTSPLGEAVDTFIRREDAERFIAEVRDDAESHGARVETEIDVHRKIDCAQLHRDRQRRRSVQGSSYELHRAISW